MSILIPFLALISTIVPCPSLPPQKCLDRFPYFEECFCEIQCQLLCHFPFSGDYTFLCGALHFELSGKAEMNYVYAFFAFKNFFKDIFLTHQCHHRLIKMGEESSSLDIWNFKFIQMKICLHIKLNICFTHAIALDISEVSRESFSESITT